MTTVVRHGRGLRCLDVSADILDLLNDEDVPLVERLRLSATFTGLVDEYFGTSAAGLMRQTTAGVSVRASGGRTPGRRLHEISVLVHGLVTRYDDALHDAVVPAMARRGVTVIGWHEATELERSRLHALFCRWIEPVLTPLTVDATHPFPYIRPLAMNLAILLRDRESGRERFAQLTLPPLVPQLLAVAGPHFVPVEDVVGAHLAAIFAGSEVVASHCFRVTRSCVSERRHNTAEASNPLTRDLRPRRFGTPVRLEIDGSMPQSVLSLLVRELGVRDSDIYRLRSPLSMGAGLCTILDMDYGLLREHADRLSTVIDGAVSSAGTVTASRAATRSGPASDAAPRSLPSQPPARAVS